MISDDEAEAAAHWIRDNAMNMANAKAERIYQEERKKVIKATVFEHSEGTMAERENAALASNDYQDQVETYREAVRKETELFTRCKAAEAKIEVWRSQSANLRGKI